MNEAAPPPVKGRFSINVIENDHGEILLLKRSIASKYGPGLWGFPAGHFEENENAEQCARRELQEEVGADISLEPVKHLQPVRDRHYGGCYEFYLFHLRWIDGKITLNHEHTDFAWVNKEDYKSYDVMRGVDEDLLYLQVWPRDYLNQENLP